MKKIYTGTVIAVMALCFSTFITGCTMKSGASLLSSSTALSSVTQGTSSSEIASGTSNVVDGSSLSSTTDASVIPNDSDGIPDKAFYQAILTTAVGENEIVDKNKDGILQRSETSRIPKVVNWNNKGIQSIQGIENLPILEVHLNGNKISDISPIAKLSGKIKTGGEPLNVELRENHITSIKSFGTLMAKSKSPHIESLDLSNNSVSDISSIADISIKKIILNHNQIATVGRFLSDNQCFFLDLSYNQIPSLGDCKLMAYSVNLSHNKISTIQSFSSSVEELNLSENELKDVSFLKGVKEPGPSKLNLSNNKLSYLPDMKNWGWTNLKPDKDGEEYMVRFEGNHLSRNELQTKLPTEFFSKIGVSSGGSERWLDNQAAK